MLSADTPSADASRSYDGSSSYSRSSGSPANDDAWSPKMFEAGPMIQQQQHHHDPTRPQTAGATHQPPLFAHDQYSGANRSVLTRPPQVRSVSTPLIVPAIQLPVSLSRRLLGGGHHSPLPPYHDGPSPLERDPHTPMQHQQHAQQMQHHTPQQHTPQHMPSTPQLTKIEERVKLKSPALGVAPNSAAFSPYTSASSGATLSVAGSPAASKKKKNISQKRQLFGEELERNNEMKAKQARDLRAKKRAYMAALEERIAQQQQLIALLHARNINEPMDQAAAGPVDIPAELARLASLPPLQSPWTHPKRATPQRQTPSSADSGTPMQALVLSPSRMQSRRSSVVTPSSFRSSVPSPASTSTAAAGASSSHPNTPGQSVSRLMLASNRRSVPSALDHPPISPTHLSQSASPDPPRSMSMEQLYSLPEQSGNWAMSDHGHEVAAAGGGSGVLSPHLHQLPPQQAHWHQTARPSSAYQQAPFMLPDAALQSRILSAPHAAHNMAADRAASSSAASGSIHDTPPSTSATSSRVRSRAETPHVAHDASPMKRGRLEDERFFPAMRHEAHRPQGVPHVLPLRPGSSTPLDVLHLGGDRSLARQLSSADSVSDLTTHLAISTPPQMGAVAHHQPLPVLSSPPAATATWLDGGAGSGMNWPSTCSSIGATPFVFSSSASPFGTSLNQLSISSSSAAGASAASSAPTSLRRLQDADPTQQSIFSAATSTSPLSRARHG